MNETRLGVAPAHWGREQRDVQELWQFSGRVHKDAREWLSKSRGGCTGVFKWQGSVVRFKKDA